MNLLDFKGLYSVKVEPFKFFGSLTIDASLSSNEITASGFCMVVSYGLEVIQVWYCLILSCLNDGTAAADMFDLISELLFIIFLIFIWF